MDVYGQNQTPEIMKRTHKGEGERDESRKQVAGRREKWNKGNANHSFNNNQASLELAYQILASHNYVLFHIGVKPDLSLKRNKHIRHRNMRNRCEKRNGEKFH